MSKVNALSHSAPVEALPDFSVHDRPGREHMTEIIKSLGPKLELGSVSSNDIRNASLWLMVRAETEPGVQALLDAIGDAAREGELGASSSDKWKIIDIDPLRHTANGQLPRALIAAVIEQMWQQLPSLKHAGLRRLVLGQRHWGADLMDWVDESDWSPTMQSRFAQLIRELLGKQPSLRVLTLLRNLANCEPGELRATMSTLAPLIEHQRTLVAYGVVYGKSENLDMLARANFRIDLPNPAPDQFRTDVRRMLLDESTSNRLDSETLLRWARAFSAVAYPLKSRAMQIVHDYQTELARLLGSDAVQKRMEVEGEAARRVMFFALLSAGHAKFMDRLRDQPDGADVYMRFQRLFQTYDPPNMGGARSGILETPPWSTYMADSSLRNLFRLCLGARTPLVRPFFSRRSAAAYLWPGSSGKWRAMTDDSEALREIWNKVLGRSQITPQKALDELLHETEIDAREAREFDEHELLIELAMNLQRYRDRFAVDSESSHRISDAALSLAEDGLQGASFNEDVTNRFRANLAIARIRASDGAIDLAEVAVREAAKLAQDEADRLRVQEVESIIATAYARENPKDAEAQNKAQQSWKELAKNGAEQNDDASLFRGIVNEFAAWLRKGSEETKHTEATKLERAARSFEDEDLDSIAPPVAKADDEITVFMSYAGPTELVVNQVQTLLAKKWDQTSKPLRPLTFFNYRTVGDIKAGDEWDVSIFENLRKATVVLAFVGKEYVGRFECQFEARIACVLRRFGTRVLWLDLDGAGSEHEFRRARIEAIHKGKRLTESDTTMATDEVLGLAVDEIVGALNSLPGRTATKPAPAPAHAHAHAHAHAPASEVSVVSQAAVAKTTESRMS